MKFSDNRPAPPPAFGEVAGSGREPQKRSGHGVAEAGEDCGFDLAALLAYPNGEGTLRLVRQLFDAQMLTSGQMIGNIQPLTTEPQQWYGTLEQLDNHLPDVPILSTLIGCAKIGAGIYLGKLSTGEAIFDGVKQVLGLAGFAASHLNPGAEKAVKLLTVLVDGGKVAYLLHLRRFYKAPPERPLVPASPGTTLKSATLKPFVLDGLVGSWVNLPKLGSGQIIGSIPDFSTYKPQQWNTRKKLPGSSYISPIAAMKVPASNVYS